MSEEVSGALGGAANGANAGASFGPWSAAIGGIAGAIGGALGGHSKKKARKKAEKRLREALAKLMAGSTDAYGNTLSAASNGRWLYNLSDAGKNAKSIAESALLNAKNYQNKTPRQLADDNALIQALAQQKALNNARSAVSLANLRTGSAMNNAVANIARQSQQNLRNSWLQGLANAKNSAEYNLTMRNNLANTASNAMKPLSSMQTNLQNMVKGLNYPTAQMAMGVAGTINGMQNQSLQDQSNMLLGASNNLMSAYNTLNANKNAKKIGDYQFLNFC